MQGCLLDQFQAKDNRAKIFSSYMEYGDMEFKGFLQSGKAQSDCFDNKEEIIVKQFSQQC